MPTTNTGFSLIELFVIIILVLILAGMLLPAQGMVREGARKANCGNNQRQIILACNVYPTNQDTVWPVFTANAFGHWVSSSDPTLDPISTAIASFELVATATGGDLLPKVLACPSNPTVRPASDAALRGDRQSTSGWASAGPLHIGYAYDWSVPSNASRIRVVTADRNRTVHGTYAIMVGFADGHVGNLTRQGSRAATSVTFLNRDANEDDIFSDLNDGPMHIPGEGSTTRAFVR